MNSKITTTPVSNIKDMAVIDNKKVETRTFDTHKDVLTFYDVKLKETRQDALIRMSLYDDLLVLGAEKYAILGMFSG